MNKKIILKKREAGVNAHTLYEIGFNTLTLIFKPVYMVSLTRTIHLLRKTIANK